MGTKNNPGKFDCYEAAHPDEPMFVLLGRDPLAAHLVSIWAKVRMGDWEAAHDVFEHMIKRRGARYGVAPDVEKAAEAIECSSAMLAWFEAWRASKEGN